tara:strand:+ start:2654 stop:2920 length:267 start_codon:yes stop_codon:yes gene_type:complete
MTTKHKEYIPHKDNFELLEKRLKFLQIYLNEKESYVNSLVDFDRWDDCEVNDEFEDISTMFHRASMSVYELMQIKNQLKDHILNKEEN